MTHIDDETIEGAYARLFPIIVGKCARMLADPEEARDVAQETFARIWAERVNLRDARAMTAWVYRTSTNLAIDRYRDPWRKERAEAPDWEQLGTTAADPEARTHWRRMLAHLRRTVPRREMEVAILSRLDGLTHAEIAQVTGTGERTVRRLLVGFEERIARLRQGSEA
ncbi:RNA polymerase sigma factor [Chondromyces apiculatus]|uniref:Sigma-24 protein n=1 Tax=Chondromyces apiculatus DSM 436 TaxID=1192034 RepID=A0A017TC66_9BACT|nr:RNA polymerase sigma factor [Chondromyces apiculatus]EYF06400.1 sigma-24 protein [Chondromyces apiculatus DSM 436]